MRGRGIIGLVIALVLAASACAWTERFGGAGRSAYNPFGGMDVTQAARLHEAWRSTNSLSFMGLLDGRLAYGVSTSGLTARIEAYSADGGQSCSGVPRVCAPVWVSGSFGARTEPGPPDVGYPILVDRYLAVPYLSGDQYRVSLFDRDGTASCTTGTPRVCQPLGTATLFPLRLGDSAPSIVAGDGAIYAVGWYSPATGAPIVGVRVADIVGCAADTHCGPFMKAATDALNHAPAYADGRLFVRSSTGVEVFDGAGTVNCSTGTCAKLRQYIGVGGFVVTVAHSRLIMNDRGRVQVFDASGLAGCAGIPRTCGPLWESDTSASSSLFSDGVLATGDLVLAPGVTAAGLAIQAYDLHGSQRCSGSPGTCTPVWHVPVTTQPEVIGAGNVAIAGGAGGGLIGPLIAFKLDGSGCSASDACPLLASYSLAEDGSPVAVASGRVLIAGSGRPFRLYRGD